VSTVAVGEGGKFDFGRYCELLIGSFESVIEREENWQV
jgi:hypothetical protein